jgi:transcriptional regulator with XRE-family HTH domain
MEFNERLKLIRKKEKYTQEEFAASIGCGLSTLGHYEAGRREPTQNILTALCNKFPEYTIWIMTGKTNFPEQIGAITESKQED